MADIAEQAGVSRQTLYVHFQNKDEMLAAAMQHVIDELLDKLQTQWSQSNSLEETLTAYFDIAVIGTFELIRAQPDVKELLLGVGELSSKVSANADKRKVQLLEKELRPYSKQFSAAGTDSKSVSQFIVTSTAGFKYNVKKRAELIGLLETLKQSVLALAN